MRDYVGSIEDVLASGEYDSGDRVIIKYDELFDLVQQIRLVTSELSFCDCCSLSDEGPESIRVFVERKSNRPLHPCLGGKSPYSEFLLPL